MGRCLRPQDIEGVVAGTLPSRRMSTVQRHVRECETCASAVEEAQANERWLRELRDADEVAELRHRLASAAGVHITAPADLTHPPSER